MFKLVVLCVFAAAVAEPEPALLYSSPYYSSYPAVIPATTTITKQSSLIAHPSPIVYSSPYAYSHFIKKRSADPEPEAKPEPEATPEPEAKPDPQLLAYSSSSLYYPNTLSSPVISNPFFSGYGYSAYPYSSQWPLATHLIKKRSAQFLAPTYVPSTYSVPTYNPYYPTTYLGNKFYPGASIGAVYGQHLIKKRSADAVLPYSPYVTPYTYPSTYYGNGYYPAVPTTYIGNNYYSGAGVVGLHSIKKRSAALLASPTFYTPTTYAAASPLFTSTYSASSPLVSSLPYIASPYAYSTYIKK